MNKYFFLLFLSLFSFAQNNYPTNYFQPPLDINLYLTGNFGELRSNHFHSGLDFATYGKEGFPVFSAASGYVSRIKVSPFGYGKALYITHPNGYTTVYAHLQKYAPKIEEIAKKAQYQQKRFDVELFFKATEITVDECELVALSGNSGGSEGAHLHFEIRDTKSEYIINPLHFGFDKLIADTEKPSIYSLLVYPLNEKSVVNTSLQPVLVPLTKQNDSTYIASPVLAMGEIGFSVQAFDYQQKKGNKNGVYKVQSFINDTLSYDYQMDTFSFDETRYINNFIDYGRNKTTNQKFQKLFYKNPYSLSIINHNKNSGKINVSGNDTLQYSIKVSDFHKHTVSIEVPVRKQFQKPIIPSNVKKTKYLVKYKTENIFGNDTVEVYFPKGSVYDDFYLDYEYKNGVLKLNNRTVPIHNAVTLKFSVEKYTETQRNKMFIAEIVGSKVDYISTYKTEKLFSGKIKSFGTFKLLTDTIAPKITNCNLLKNKTITNQKHISATITDSLSGIKTYNGYLNNQWILMEYDAKNDKLIHYLDDVFLVSGKNILRIEVTDNCENTTTFEVEFFK